LSSDNTAFSEQRDSEALVAEESKLESSIVSDIQDPVADKAEVSTSTTDNTSTEEQAQDSKLDTDPVTGPIRESASSSLTDSSEIDLSKEINLQDIESLIQVDLVNSSGPTVDEQDTQQEATPDPTKKQSA
ncbi:MAG: hypothetical protein KUG75_02655, partial [Pseudomonadales bacterium]|nr:hypothetical protein [Pseudomonadales bacterium]